MIILQRFAKNSKDIVLVEKENGCLECISHSKDDCGYTRIRYNGKHDRLFRVLYQLKFGDIPEGMLIRHKCDNPSCSNVDHLEIGTMKDNVRDMIERGRSKQHSPKPTISGTKNKFNKLSENDVKEIYLSELGYRKLSHKFNVSRTTIMLIKKKLMWKWFTDKLD